MNHKAFPAIDRSRSGTFELPCLGIPFKLGMLYDCRENKIVPGMTLWDEKVLKSALSECPQPSSEFDVIAEDSLSKKMSGLEMGGNLGLSVISGLVGVEGAAKFVYDLKSSSNQARVSLKYKSTTNFQQLTMEQLAIANIQYPDVFEKDIATHVVTAVLYGAEAFFIFDREVQANEKYHNVHGKMEALVKIIPSIPFGFGGGIGLNNDKRDIQETEKFHCKFYGDLILDRNPSTYEDAVQVYNELPKYVSDQQPVPKKVWLYPLCNLDSRASQMVRDISHSLFRQTQEVMDALNNIEIRTNDLKRNVVYNNFPVLKEQICQFQNVISEHKINFKKQLSKLLPRIRGGGAEEEELADALVHQHKSPLSVKSQERWLKGKEDELKVLTAFLNTLSKVKGIVMSFERGDLETELFDIDNYDYVVSLEFKFSKESDGGILQNMISFLHSASNLPEVITQPEFWYRSNETLKNIRVKVKQFSEFAQMEMKRVKYIVTDTSEERDSHITAGAIMMHYTTGQFGGTEVVPPSQPGPPTAVDKQENSIRLEWKAPQHGANGIQCYKVSYRKKSQQNEKWLSAQTRGNERVVKIDNLIENMPYVFKVSAKFWLGYGEESEECVIETKQHPIANIKPISQSKGTSSATSQIFLDPTFSTVSHHEDAPFSPNGILVTQMELYQLRKELKSVESDILANKDFTYSVKITKQHKIDLPSGMYTINCLKCNYTCHSRCICTSGNDADKWMCKAMRGSKANATCTVCPGQCHWKNHLTTSYYFEFYEETEIRTSDDLKKRYDCAISRKREIETSMAKLEKKLKQLQM